MALLVCCLFALIVKNIVCSGDNELYKYVNQTDPATEQLVEFAKEHPRSLENLPDDVAQEISARDPDYYNRDLYNAIENQNYPAWELEMDVLTFENIKNINYNKFDVTRLWKKDTYIRMKIPIGILTTSAGRPVEIRESITLNSDGFSNPYHIDLLTHADAERTPERIVHAKGTAAIGYFIVTHDVSKYTKADVFNGIGKKTPVVGRFSTIAQNKGGTDLERATKALAAKFFTSEGNLDLLMINLPIFLHKDPLVFTHAAHAIKRNPKTNLYDLTTRWDFVTRVADTFHTFMWLFSDFGIPNGYRKMDIFPIHTYEINNKHGDRYFVRFNFRTEQGLENLPDDVAQDISVRDPDYFTRDLYDAIENKNYPAWELEMDILTLEEIKHLDYNPFDVIRLWKRGTYHTVKVGRLIFNKNPDNVFRVAELSAFNPGNLVPGIPGPIDTLFRSRRSSYREAQVYRLGVNHNREDVNVPLHWNVYDRNGVPPVRDNMKDVPNYYPNSFHGPTPYVDPSRPKERLSVLQANVVDLEPINYFFNHVLDCEQRQRLINNTIPSLIPISPKLRRRVVRLFTLTDPTMGKKLTEGLERALKMPQTPPPPVLKV
ncbi:unnamed protein product, partial [Brenthis ino]